LHVRQGQLVKMTLTNGGTIPHSIDFHAARIAPNLASPQHGVQTVQVPAGGGGVFDVKIDQAGLYPFVSHAFAHVDLGQVGLLKVGNPPGTMSH
jgi:nitrite reductase (NO-forming)